jgi:hypothetical protein
MAHLKQSNGACQMAQPQYVNETNTLRAIARDKLCRFRWTKHALDEVAKDGRTTDDVEHSLIGKDIDGNRIQVVVAVYEEEITIKIITTF